MALDAPQTETPQRDEADARLWRAPGIIPGAVVLTALVIVGTLALSHGAEDATGVVSALLRFARYLGALVAVGGFVFLAFVRPPRLPVEARGRRLALVAAVVGAGASLLALPVHAAYLSGRVGSAVDGATLGTVATSGFGQSIAVGVVGLILIAFGSAKVPAPVGLGVGAAGSLLALGAFLLTGHSVVSDPQAVALPANLAHTAGAAVWLGGLLLLPLALAERRAAEDPVGGAQLVARFSTAATAAVLMVGAAGLALAWVEVRALSAMTTPYGMVLLAKIALVGAVAALGTYNNRRLVPEIRAGGGWERLARVVRFEAAGLVVVIAITAVLVNIVPARVDAGVDAQEVRYAQLGAERTISLVVEPARPGTNEVHIYVAGGGLDRPLDELTIGLVPPGGDAVTTTIEPTRVGPGHWLHLGSEFSAAGEWRLELTARGEDEQEQVTLTIPITGAQDWDEL